MHTGSRSRAPRYILMLLALTALIVAACSPAASRSTTGEPQPTQATSGEGTPAPAPSSAAEEPVKLTIWTAYGKQLAPAIEAYNQKMKAEGKNVQIGMVELGGEEIPDKFAVGLATGDVPDILDLDLVLAPRFASMGAFTDITSLVQEAGLKDDFNPKFLDLGVWDDRIYMLPFSADVSALFYNKDILKAAGLDPEMKIETWDDMTEMVLAVKNAQLKTEAGLPIYGFASSKGPGGKMFCDMPFIWTNGGNWLDDQGSVILDSPETLEAMQWYTDLLFNKDKVAPPNPAALTWDDKMNMFYGGQVAMIATGSYAMEEVKDRAPDLNYGVCLFPHPEGKGAPTAFIGGDLIGIPKASTHAAEAWEFILYALSPEVQIEIWAQNGLPPVRLSLAENKYFDAEPRYYVFFDGVRMGQVPKTVHYNELYDPWGIVWDEIFEGTKPLEQILADAATRMREIVSQ